MTLVAFIEREGLTAVVAVGGTAELTLHIGLHVYAVCTPFFLEYLRMTGTAFVYFFMPGMWKVNRTDALYFCLTRLQPVKDHIAEPAY